ncbi:MAG: glycerol-3-phosphate 1-O-acyltransferase PlsY [Lactobacillales bacterium]|jgi:glycerol-3-phosphate acyltransferase PlsY|nr:glycerol-3-phosphate 1-O-acyltransferase PlsY [Lactobacillales bacterium]
MLLTLILIVFAYLLGSIPTGLWIGLVFFKKDLRQVGSGNTGTTNTFRVLGKGAGTVTFIIDAGKGAVPVMVAAALHPEVFGFHLNPLFIGVFAVIGHVFPVFAKFKGGKAVATSVGLLLGYAPGFFVLAMVLFFIFLLITSYVSFASIATCVISVVFTILIPLFHLALIPTFDPVLTVITLALSVFIIVRHKENIARLRAGTENIVPFGLNYWSQPK